MPYGWIDPEVFVTHNDVPVYHIYKNDEVDAGRREYWFTTDIYGGDFDDSYSFDVRELSTFAQDKPFEQIICEAIERGELSVPVSQ